MNDRLISADKARQVLTHLLYETAMNNELDIADIYEDIAEKRLDTWIELIPTVEAVRHEHLGKDIIYRQDAIELAMQYCPDDDGTCSKAGEDMRNLLDELEDLPSAVVDAEPTEEQVKEYCRKRGLVIVDSELFNEIKARWSSEPVRQGHWIKMSDADGIYYACSKCGYELPRVNSFDPQFDLFPKLKCIDKTTYCSSCGAKMDEHIDTPTDPEAK